MDVITSAAVSAATSVDRYDALYLNTPWKKLSVAELETLPIKDLCKPNATLFMWTDSFSVADAAQLISKWGLKFVSVASIMNLAEKLSIPAAPTHIAPSAPSADASTEPSADASASVSVPVSVSESASSSAPATESQPAAKARGPRIKSIQAPAWWGSGDCLSRPTTEQLWVAQLGEGAAVNPKFKTQPYQIADMPELAKAKARARQPSAWCPAEWFFRRPEEFLRTAVASLAPGSRVLELFGDSMHDNVHVLGPAIPQIYVPALSTDEGVVAYAKSALEGEGKVALRSLAAKLRKATAAPVSTETSEEGQIEEEQDSTITAVLQKANEASEMDWSSSDLKRIMSATADHKLANHASRSRKTKRASRGNLNADGTERKRYGIAAAGKISPELCEFLGEPAGTEVARTSVVKSVNAYIKENGLKEGRKINVDEKLKKLLQPEGDVDFFSLCSLLSKHFIKKPKPSPEEKSVSDETNAEPAAKKAKVEAV